MISGVPMLFGGAPAGDPYFANVVLLMHMDGADNGTTFTDVTGKTVTRLGNTVTKTATKKSGTASAYFDGTGDATTCPNNAAFRLDGDFTVELWVYLLSTAVEKFFVSHYDYSANQRDWRFGGASSTGYLEFTTAPPTGGAATAVLNAGEALPLNSWVHIATTRSGTTARIFINGVQKASSTTLTDQGGSTAALSVGSILSNGAPTFGANCYIDELRITKGVARYTANFTPPTAPFPDY